MPWDHCDVEFILDDERCPSCGADKAAWTVQVEKTRTLVIGRKRPRAAWSTTRAEVGEEVELRVEQCGLPEGSEHGLTVWEHDQDQAHDRVCEVRGRVADGVLVARWTTVLVLDDDDWASRYELEHGASTWPELFFELAGTDVRSGQGEDELLRIHGAVHEQVLDALGRPRVNVEYELLLPGGAVKRGRTDAAGRVDLGEVPPRGYRLHVLEPAPPIAPPPLRVRGRALRGLGGLLGTGDDHGA